MKLSWVRYSRLSDPCQQRDNFGLAFAPGLRQDVTHMGAHGIDRDEHCCSDLFGRQEIGHEAQHFDLSLAERLGGDAVHRILLLLPA